MDSNTGELYKDKDEALKSGVLKEDIVELEGTEEAIKRVSTAVKSHYRFEKEKKKRKQQRESRRKNRK